MTTNNKNKKNLFSRMLIALVFMLSFSTLCGCLFGANSAYAYSIQNTSLTNLNFSANNNLSNVYTNPTGWTKGFSESYATCGVINLNYFNDSFYLNAENLPTKLSDSADDHILMINSKSSTSSVPASQYYTNSSSLKLNANSSYKIVVWTQVLKNASSSIYITGLNKTIGFENIDANNAENWTSYTFYISTGLKEENIKTELWLGAKPNVTSSGAVFFDNIEVYEISNNETPDTETPESNLISTPNGTSARTKYINLSTEKIINEINGDFETDLTKWSKTVSQMKEGTYAEIIDQSTNHSSVSKNISYIGTDLSKGNKNALVLYTESDVKSYFGLKSNEISLNMYETVKVSINVKVADLTSGSAYVKFVESDVLNANGEKVEGITPISKEIAISSNSSNKLLNNYTTCSFYIKGRSLYNTSYSIELWLGNESSEACGVACFDNLRIDYISDSTFTNLTSDSTNVSVDLQGEDGSFGIKNATFNGVQKAESTLTYPLIPENWIHETSDKNDIFFGVINTYSPVYESNKSQFNNFANPENPDGFLDVNSDTNNILLLDNFNEAYQSVTSSEFTVEANKYYKLSFDYKQIARSSNQKTLNIYVQDENNNILYADENYAGTNDSWEKYTIYLSTNSYSNELKLIISLGTESSPVVGIAYIDNVTLFENTSMTAEKYQELSKIENVLDFQEGNFNLIKDNGTHVFTPLRYTGSLEVGENVGNGSDIAFGGIIDGNNTEDEFDVENSEANTNSLKYMMMIQTHGNATYSFTANDFLSLKTDSYYKFTVYIKTIFGATASNSSENYGAEFGLTGINQKISGIVSDNWTEYNIYVKCTADTTASLRFALASANVDTAGMVYFDNYSYETIDSDTYNKAKLNNESESNYLFVGDTNTDDENSSTNTPANLDYIWYVIPTLILAVALVLALVSYLMRKVKIKKWEKKKVNEYDREKTVHRDVIRQEAEKVRNTQVQELESQIKDLESKVSELKEKHQEKVSASRANRHKGVSKEAEKEFKQYAKLSTALENRIIGLQKEINNMNTPEYLLSVQHKLAVEKAKKERVSKERAYASNKKKK